jgi:hypothetical protein
LAGGMVYGRWLSEEDVHELLRQKLKGKKHAAVAKQIGVSPNYLSGVRHGAPPTGRILAYLGYRQRLYEKVKQ